eukprot:7205418-Pyramimonas_sp.AAC.1
MRPPADENLCNPLPRKYFLIIPSYTYESFPGAQALPGAPRCSRALPGAPRRSQALPGALNRSL